MNRKNKTITLLIGILFCIGLNSIANTPDQSIREFSKKNIKLNSKSNSLKLEETKRYLLTLRSVMELYYVDWNTYPISNNINDVMKILRDGVYIIESKTKDEWGNNLIYQSNGKSYEIISFGEDGIASADDIKVSGDHTGDNEELEIKKNLGIKKPDKPVVIHYSLNPGTVLSVSKNGNDVVLNWIGSGTTYDIAKATDKYFLNNSVLAVDIIANTYNYKNALISEYDEEFFDVTDETEENRAAKNNGGDLPPPQPIIDIAPADLYIGGQGTINGSNFSTFAKDNIIWFDGGVWTRAISSTSTQLNFIVPRGAISGDLSVSVGMRVSDTIETIINLENTSTPWTSIRTMGYSASVGEYWISGIYSSSNKVARIYYDTSQKKYLRDEKQTDNYQYACSTKTDNSSNKKLFCGVLTPVGGGVTKVASTNPAPGSNINFCINLDSTSLTISVRGAAPDPNPDLIPGRDVVYFAYEVTSSGLMHIKKVAADCSAVLDDDYGNMGSANFNFNPIVGMVVARNGDLYVSEKTQVIVIHPDESRAVVKTGFSNLFGLDIIQADANDTEILLISDGGTGTIYALPLDSLILYPIATASSLRACIAAAETVNSFDNSLPLRMIIAHNNGGRIPLRKYPLLGVSPAKSIKALISSPSALETAPFHSVIRPSDPNSTEYTVIKARAWWKDGIDRFLCAKVADPIDLAGYAPFPFNPSNCDNPTVVCDNKDAFVAGGVGSFVDTNQLESCKSGCGTSPCIYEFRITKRYAGDNYRVFFGTSAWIKYHGATAPIIATKRIYIEKDKMFKRGGILANDAEAGTSIIYIAKNPDGTRADNIVEGDNIAIFDSIRTYENPHDEACVCKITDGLPPPDDFKIKIDLAPIGNCSQPCNPYILSETYYASPPDPDSHEWLFTSGNSAGVGVIGSGFYEANTSDLNQPFDDAYVSFVIFNDGSGAVPYVPEINLSNDEKIKRYLRFHQIWFKNKNAEDEPDQHINKPHNYFHIMGAKKRENSNWGVTISESDISWLFNQTINDFCDANIPSCSGNCLSNCLNQLYQAYSSTIEHEIAHEFEINCQLNNYHDINDAWCNPFCADIIPELCIMNENDSWDERTDGINRLDCYNMLEDTSGCTDIDECGPGIRTNQDPK